MNSMGRRDTGFTLIELIVAMTLMAAIILPVVGRLTASSAKSHRGLSQQLTAESLLRTTLADPASFGQSSTRLDTTLSNGEHYQIIHESVELDSEQAHRFIVLVRALAGWDTCTTVVKRHIEVRPASR